MNPRFRMDTHPEQCWNCQRYTVQPDGVCLACKSSAKRAKSVLVTASPTRATGANAAEVFPRGWRATPRSQGVQHFFRGTYSRSACGKARREPDTKSLEGLRSSGMECAACVKCFDKTRAPH